MAQSCQSCGKRADLAYNRTLRFFPYGRRFFCDDCFSRLQRKEDFIFISILFAVFFLIVAAIVTAHLKKQQEVQQVIQQQDAYYDNTDLNKDGRVDLWEETATDQMRNNFRAHNYPWAQVLGPNDEGPRLNFVIHRATFMEIATQENFEKNFNFPDLMSALFKKITDPQSKTQLYRVMATLNGEIVFVIKKYDKVPAGGFTDAFFAPKVKIVGKEPEVNPNDPQVLDTMICLEELSNYKIEKMTGISQDLYHIDQFTLVKGPAPKSKK